MVADDAASVHDGSEKKANPPPGEATRPTAVSAATTHGSPPLLRASSVTRCEQAPASRVWEAVAKPRWPASAPAGRHSPWMQANPLAHWSSAVQAYRR